MDSKVSILIKRTWKTDGQFRWLTQEKKGRVYVRSNQSKPSEMSVRSPENGM